MTDAAFALALALLLIAPLAIAGVALINTGLGRSRSAAQALLENAPALDNKIITADPLHCQRKEARLIAEKGGQYFTQIKGNQPKLLEKAKGLDSLESTPFLNRPSLGMDA